MTYSKIEAHLREVKYLSCEKIAQCFDVFKRHYDCVDFDRFLNDLKEKEHIIVLEDLSGHMVGFSTLTVYELEVMGRRVRIVYSGDTIIDKAHWGSQQLVRCWCSFAGTLKAQDPDAKLYWLLISKGHRTYLYLPLFAHRFYPRYDETTPSFEEAILRTFGEFKFSRDYRPDKGIISFAESRGQLKPHVADVPLTHLSNEHVQFFLNKNSDYLKGDELACICELDATNLKSVALRNFVKGTNVPVSALYT